MCRLCQLFFYCSVILRKLHLFLNLVPNQVKIRPNHVNPDSVCLHRSLNKNRTSSFPIESTFCWCQPAFSILVKDFGLLFYGCVFCHTFKHLLGFISMITFCPSQLKTVAVLYFFWEIWKTEIHVNARCVHNISVPVSFHLNKFFKCHGTCFMKPVHALNHLVLTGTKSFSIFLKGLYWKTKQ